MIYPDQVTPVEKALIIAYFISTSVFLWRIQALEEWREKHDPPSSGPDACQGSQVAFKDPNQ